MRHIDHSEVYLNQIDQYINHFINEDDTSIRIQMVQIMEKHIIDFNHFAENILQDNQPVRFLMQIVWIKERINKINQRLNYLDLGFQETNKIYNDWCIFLDDQTKLLSQFIH
jgi:hypothetical protein